MIRKSASLTPQSAERWAWGLLIAAAAFYLLSIGRYYVGITNDDAKYILGARHVLDSLFGNLSGDPRLMHDYFWPGFEILLAPFARLIEPHWALLKAVPFGLVTTSSLLSWQLFKKRMTPASGLVLLALFAFNPMTVNASGLVMSEPFFLTTILGVFVVWDRLEAGRSADWKLGLAVAVTLLIRPEAIALALSVLVGLAYEKDWRGLRWTLGFCLAAAALLGLVLSLKPAGAGYFSAYRQNVALLGPYYAWSSAAKLGLTLFAGNILALPVPHSSAFYVLGVLLAALCAAAAAIGLNRACETEKRPGLLLSMFSFCAAFFVIHALHSVLNRRYLWIMTPFILYFMIFGIQYSLARRQSWRWLGPAAMSLLLFNCAATACITALQAPPADAAFPAKTLDWLKSHLDSKSKVLSLWPDTLRLYAGIQVEGISRPPMPSDAAAFRSRLIADGITHLLYQEASTENNLPEDRESYDWFLRSERWLRSWPAAFEPVFEDTQHGIVIYRVVDDPDFERAYLAYASGLRSLQANRLSEGSKQIREAVRLDPTFPNAWNAYGTISLMHDTEQQAAERYLQRAARLRPDYAVPILNLARLYAKRGLCQKADQFYGRALAAFAETREFDFLIDAAETEKSTLESGPCRETLSRLAGH